MVAVLISTVAVGHETHHKEASQSGWKENKDFGGQPQLG